MKADAHKQVQYLRHGMEQFLADEDKHIANGAPRLRGEQYFALGALTKLSDTKIAASYYKLPTGFGKTVMFSYMAQAYLPQARANGDTKKLVILVPRLNLINQTSDKLDSFAGFSASEFSGRTKDTDADIIIATYRSLDKLVETIGIENIGLIFADEAHHATGGKISQTMTDLIKSVPTIGFTATPSYDADKSVSNVLRTEIFAMTIADGVRSGMLSPVKNTLYCSSIVYDLENAPATSQGEYDYNSITGQIDTDTLTSEIADIYINGVDEDTGRRFIDCKAMINCPNIEMAKRQADAINQRAGRIIARAFSSDMKDFEIEKAKFIAGKYQVACQVNTMTEGFDDTTVSLCINYPTRSAVRAEQAAGRAIRLNESDPHKIAFVIDTIFRKHDSETSDTALQTARHAKQVLFKDIAGGMVLFPENFKDGVTHGRHRPHTRGNHETVKPYEIITSTETLLDLNRVDTERAKEEEIPEKTDEWLSTTELIEKFVGHSNKLWPIISSHLDELYHNKDFKGKIRLCKTSNSKGILCLHISALSAFAKASKLTLRPVGNIPKKTDKWLSVTDLKGKFIIPGKDFGYFITEKLEELQYDENYNLNIQLCQPEYGKAVLCLDIDDLDKFAQATGLTRLDSILQKTDEWLNVQELEKIFIGKGTEFKAYVTKKLEELKSDERFVGKIQVCHLKNGKDNICLHNSALSDFAEVAQLKMRGLTVANADVWLKPSDLLQDHFVDTKENRKLVREKLEELYTDPRFVGKIQQFYSANGRNYYCLHKSAVNEFSEVTGLKQKQNLNIEHSQKNEKWLNVTEIMAHFVGAGATLRKTIKEGLEKLKNDANWHSKVQYCKMPNGNTVLCLHRDALDEFARLSGLKRRGEVTPEKFHAGTKVVKAMTQMAESKKQTKDTITPDNQYE